MVTGIRVQWFISHQEAASWLFPLQSVIKSSVNNQPIQKFDWEFVSGES